MYVTLLQTVENEFIRLHDVLRGTTKGETVSSLINWKVTLLCQEFWSTHKFFFTSKACLHSEYSCLMLYRNYSCAPWDEDILFTCTGGLPVVTSKKWKEVERSCFKVVGLLTIYYPSTFKRNFYLLK